MYSESNNITCEKVDIAYDYNGKDSCLNCMTYGAPYHCPRDGTKCIFVDHSEYSDCENLKIGCFNIWKKAITISFCNYNFKFFI